MSEHPGPTGQFPRGKLNEHDDGELRVALGIDLTTRTIVMDFSRKISWLGLDHRSAKELAAKLEELAESLDAIPNRSKPPN